MPAGLYQPNQATAAVEQSDTLSARPTYLDHFFASAMARDISVLTSFRTATFAVGQMETHARRGWT
jgi:hypothetical protein